MGKKTSKSTVGPSKFAQPYISSAANAVQGAYAGNQQNIADLTSTLQSNLPTVLNQTLNNTNLANANSYNNDVLSGKYLDAGNPFLAQQIADTNADVTNGVNAAIGTRGGAGGSAQAAILARQLAKNETNLRYTDYNNERTNQQQAASTAGGLATAGNSGLAAALAYIQEQAQLPQSGADQYASTVGGLMGNYNTSSGTPSAASSIASGLGTALSLASIFSDRRLKRDIMKIGEMADGLGRYRFRYIWDDEMREGVMADEVAKLRPWALGPVVAGFATVNMGML